jgi:hypothetical protein
MCDIIFDNKFNVYHIANNPDTVSLYKDKITYVPIIPKSFDLEKIKEILKLCSSTNILIYISICNNTTHQHLILINMIKDINTNLNKIIKDNPSKYYSNVTILNFTDSLAGTIYNLRDTNGKNYFKKILNIFNNSSKLYFPTELGTLNTSFSDNKSRYLKVPDTIIQKITQSIADDTIPPHELFSLQGGSINYKEIIYIKKSNNILQKEKIIYKKDINYQLGGNDNEIIYKIQPMTIVKEIIPNYNKEEEILLNPEELLQSSTLTMPLITQAIEPIEKIPKGSILNYYQIEQCDYVKIKTYIDTKHLSLDAIKGFYIDDSQGYVQSNIQTELENRTNNIKIDFICIFFNIDDAIRLKTP